MPWLYHKFRHLLHINCLYVLIFHYSLFMMHLSVYPVYGCCILHLVPKNRHTLLVSLHMYVYMWYLWTYHISVQWWFQHDACHNLSKAFSGHQSLSLKSNAKQLLQPAVTSPLILHIVSMICVFTMWPASAKYKMYEFIPLLQAEVIWKIFKNQNWKEFSFDYHLSCVLIVH